MHVTTIYSQMCLCQQLVYFSTEQLVAFSALTLLVQVIWPVKIVQEMTYNVLSGMLSLYTITTTTSTTTSDE